MKAGTIRNIFSNPSRVRSSQSRLPLRPRERGAIRAKTAGTCHVCGGPLGAGWQADHVVPHRRGGAHSLDNYLPACRICNSLRRGYDPPVLRAIIRMGVYVKQEIRQDTELAPLLTVLARKRLNRSARRRRH